MSDKSDSEAIALEKDEQIAVAHRGRVEALSAGLGTGAPAILPGLPRGLRVLLVDDNEDSAEVLSELLRLKGHEVMAVHDGAAALKARPAFLPHVALLDIGLPAMDGYELARHLRAQQPTPRLRLIAITGYGEEKDRLRAKAAGFDEHLVKPIEVERVFRLLSSIASALPRSC